MNVLIRRVLPVAAFVLIPWLIPNVARADSAYTFAVGGGVSECSETAGTFVIGYCPTHGPNRGQHFAFSATDTVGALPNAASGHAVFWFTNEYGYKIAQIQGPVTCLQWAGNTAIITYNVAQSQTWVAKQGTQASGVPQPGPTSFVTFMAMDGGEGSGTIDQITTPVPSTGPCGETNQFPTPVVAGNIVVSMSSPLPSTALTDNSTYNILNTGDVYFNSGDGWLAA